MTLIEELADKEFLFLTSQVHTEFFSCCLRLLPFCSSTFHQTIVEIAQNRPEEIPLFSRIQSLNLLLEVDDHDKEEYSVVTFFIRWVKFLWMGWQEYVFVVLLWPLIGLQKHVHSISTQNCRTASRRFPALCRRPPCCSSP